MKAPKSPLACRARHADFSEPVNESVAPERCTETALIKAQSAVVARATASICNAEQGGFRVQGGCEGLITGPQTFRRLATRACSISGCTSAGATAAPTFSPTRLNMPRRKGRTMAPPRSMRLK